MVIDHCVLLVEGVEEKVSKTNPDKTYFSGKFSSGSPFDYPSFFICNKAVADGFYNCAVRISYDKDSKRTNVSVAIGDPYVDPTV